MPGLIGSGVTLRGFTDENFSYTWNLTGTIVAADVGKAMSQDTTVNESAKLAVADEVIIGELRSFEDRVQEGIKVGAIKRKGTMLFQYTGTAPALGTGVVGSATPGKVKAQGTPGAIVNNIVVAVNTTDTTVLVMLD